MPLFLQFLQSVCCNGDVVKVKVVSLFFFQNKCNYEEAIKVFYDLKYFLHSVCCIGRVHKNQRKWIINLLKTLQFDKLILQFMHISPFKMSEVQLDLKIEQNKSYLHYFYSFLQSLCLHQTIYDGSLYILTSGCSRQI